MTPHPAPAHHDRARHRALVAIAVLLAAVVASAAVLATSSASFTATTDNTGNNLRTSTVVLTAGVGQALFDVDGLTPGETVRRCVEVTYDGTLAGPSAVRLYSRGFRDPSGLADHLDVVVVEGAAGSRCGTGAGGGTAILADTLAAFDARHRDHATGVGSWVPRGERDSRAYRIAITLGTDTPPDFSGTRVDGLAFGWEVTS